MSRFQEYSFFAYLGDVGHSAIRVVDGQDNLCVIFQWREFDALQDRSREGGHRLPISEILPLAAALFSGKNFKI